MKRVYSAQDGLFVEYLQQLLEEQGIPTVLRNQFLSGGVGELPPNECWPELWVTNDADASAARQLIDDAIRDLDTPRENWTCPNCGERIEGQFTACWNCGYSASPTDF